MSDAVLKNFWTDKLQPHTTQILASLLDELELEKLSEIADKIYDNNQDKSVHATSYSTTNTSRMDKSKKLSQLEKNIVNLPIQIQSLIQNQKFSSFSHRNQKSILLSV